MANIKNLKVNGTTYGINAHSADSATKLKTARSIALGTGATGTATNFDGSSNITIPVTSVKESYLDWGGKSISGSVSPVGASLSSEHSANRLAYLNPNALSFEYSDNGGSTWSTLSVSNDTKIGFVTTSGTFTVGNATPVTTNHRSRVTITAQNGTTGYVYTRPRKLLLNVSSPHGLSVLIETKTGATNASWNTVGTYSLSGWSGWNDIPLSFSTLGGSKGQTSNIWYMRLTFATTSVNSTYSDTKSSIIGMRLFGDTCWTKTSNMGETGHLYSYDTGQNARFPAKVIATSFEGNGASITSLNASNISSGTLSADRLATSGVTASSYGPSANTSPSHGGTFSVPYITVDNKGRVTAASTKTITLPAATDTKVTQTSVEASNYTYWRPLIIGNSASATEGFTPSSVTDQVITANTISCQPSSGTIRANVFKENGTTLSNKYAVKSHTHSVTAKGSISNTTAGGSVSSTFTGTAHNHTFTGSAVTSGKPDTTNVTTIYSITGVGSLPSASLSSGTLPSCSYTAPSHTYTAPSLSASVSNQCLTLTWSAGSHSFSAGSHSFSAGEFPALTFNAGSLPTRSSAISMPNTNHTHSVTASGTVANTTATGSVSSTFTGTAHNHTFTGSAVTSATES